MSQQQFDKLIKEKLAQQNYVPSDDGWNDIQSRIAILKKQPIPEAPANANKIATASVFSLFSVKKIAAILLPLIAIWGTYTLYQSNASNNTEIVANTITTAGAQTATTSISNITAEAPAATIENVVSNTNTISSLKNTNTFDKKNTNYKPAVNNTVANKQIISNTDLNAIHNKIEQKIIPNTNDVAIENKPIIENKIVDKIKNDGSEQTPVVKEIIAKNTETNQKEKQLLPLELPNTNTKNKFNARTGISMVAGAMVNTTINNSSGFNVGIAAEKSLSKRLYIDASVMVARNNPSWLQNQLAATNVSGFEKMAEGYTINNTDNSYINSYGVNPATNTFRAGDNNIAVDELADDASIAAAAAYRLASTQIEAIPMIGYRLVPRLNIAAGADAVHILQSNSYKDGVDRLLLQSQSNTTLRSWDMGFVGKVEYKITKRIILGYRHREGITSITNGTSKKRNYNGVVLRVRMN